LTAVQDEKSVIITIYTKTLMRIPNENKLESFFYLVDRIISCFLHKSWYYNIGMLKMRSLLAF